MTWKKWERVAPPGRVTFKMTPMIGRSHGIHAEPITFGLKLALMFDEFGRAEERIDARQASAFEWGKLVERSALTRMSILRSSAKAVVRNLGQPATI